jgi:hypothetical protein
MVHGDCNENDRNPVVDGKLIDRACELAPAAAFARRAPSLVRD